MNGLSLSPSLGLGASERCLRSRRGASWRSKTSFSAVAQNCRGLPPSLPSSIPTKRFRFNWRYNVLPGAGGKFVNGAKCLFASSNRNASASLAALFGFIVMIGHH